MLSMPRDDDTPAWDAETLRSPHTQADKAQRVRRMFNAIAPTYELVNRVFSAGRDRAWRRRAVELAGVTSDDIVLNDGELEDARWFTRKELRSGFPKLPFRISIARRLVDGWIERT